MSISDRYECLRDSTRLRILNLLLDGPLCVCHLSEILGEVQPKISRHLKILRSVGVLETERCHNWTICRISAKLDPFFSVNLDLIREARKTETSLAKDSAERATVWEQLVCGDGEPTPVSTIFQEFDKRCCETAPTV